MEILENVTLEEMLKPLIERFGMCLVVDGSEIDITEPIIVGRDYGSAVGQIAIDADIKLFERKKGQEE